MIDLSKIHLFRMVQIENISHVLKYGITHKASPNANKNFAPIGDSSIINTRIDFVIPNRKKLGDYIPFYFGVRMPMLYVIQNGFNGVSCIDPEKIVYCVSCVEEIINHNLPYIFTDGHAVNGLTSFYTNNNISNIETLVDFKAVKAKYWRNENDLDLKRRKEAEFLVENDIPLSAIIGWIVYNENAKLVLESEGIVEELIYIRPICYF